MKSIAGRARRMVLRHSGLNLLRWKRLPHRLYCFNYHRIGDRDTTLFDPNVFSCTAEHLDAHISELKQHFRILSLEELVSLVEYNEVISERLALLTFDDGYIDSYTKAFPVLESHSVSAVFFVTTDFVGSKTIPWWDEAAWWVRHATADQILLPTLGINERLPTDGNFGGLIRKLLSAFKKSPSEIDANLAMLKAALEPSAEANAGEGLFMDWDHLRSLADAGMFIGSHTKSHRILSELSDSELNKELVSARETISEQLNRPVLALAYPVGSAGTFDDRAVSAARQTGHPLAFNFIERSNPWPLSNPSSICRIGIDANANAQEFMASVCDKL